MNKGLGSQEEWTGELEQRIVDMESDIVHLKSMIERIGKEKRTCVVPGKAGWWVYFLVVLMAIDTGLALFAIIK